MDMAQGVGNLRPWPAENVTLSVLTEILLQDKLPWKVKPKEKGTTDTSLVQKTTTYEVVTSSSPTPEHTDKETDASDTCAGIGAENEDSIILIAENERIKTSRQLLMKHSDYFQAMFTTDMRESKQSFIDLVDVTAEALHAVLQFCKFGEVDICSDHVHQFLHAASLFQVWPVCNACELFLSSVLSRDNLIEILDIADHYHAVRLLQESFTFIRKNFVELSVWDLLLQLKADHLIALLQCDKSIKASEYEIFCFAKRWVGADVHSRNSSLPKILKYIKFPLMTLLELTTINSTPERWLKDCPEFRQHMTTTFWYRNHVQEQPLHPSWQTVPRDAVDCLMVFMDDDSILLENNELTAYITPVNGHNRRFVKKCLKLEWKRDGYAICSWNGFLYVAGGYDPQADRNLQAVHCYDPATKTWQRAQSMLHRKANFTLDALGDRLVATGGRQTDSILDNKYSTNLKILDAVEWYNCVTDSWIQAAPMPTCLYGHASATMKGNLFISGGHSNVSSSIVGINLLYSYDSQSNEWISHPAMHHQRYYHCMTNAGDHLYVMGGINYDSLRKTWNFIQDIECFNPATQQWTFLSCQPNRRSQFGAASHQDTIFVLGGMPVPGIDGRKTVLEYSVNSNRWVTSPDLQLPSCWPTTCCILKLPPDLFGDGNSY